MAAGNPIRGSRVGAGRMGESDRGESAPRQRFEFYCANNKGLEQLEKLRAQELKGK